MSAALGFQANPASSKVKPHRGMRPEEHDGSGWGRKGFTVVQTEKRKNLEILRVVSTNMREFQGISGSCWFQICSVWSFHKLSLSLTKEAGTLFTRDKQEAFAPCLCVCVCLQNFEQWMAATDQCIRTVGTTSSQLFRACRMQCKIHRSDGSAYSPTKLQHPV
jgi:hypothetical protein